MIRRKSDQFNDDKCFVLIAGHDFFDGSGYGDFLHDAKALDQLRTDWITHRDEVIAECNLLYSGKRRPWAEEQFG